MMLELNEKRRETRKNTVSGKGRDLKRKRVREDNPTEAREQQQLKRNGENNTEGDITTWLNKEIKAICAPLGILKNECIKEFQAKEQQIIDAINNKADPHAACHDMDFCD
ncbi:hypothetical protein WR25_17947 [Diploscapter pachys]|uniref:Saposin B-type domain-containing protein n=1 Tax=Diploscapter pachys TaxID=2018661 RepID=A0A2A2LD30_9BILA|nr:hypothetical protein WR25_17947 [Diploscapter pachys]